MASGIITKGITVIDVADPMKKAKPQIKESISTKTRPPPRGVGNWWELRSFG